MLLRLAASSIKTNTRLLPSIKQFHTSSFISNVNESRTDPFSPNYDKKYSENLLKFQTETPTPDSSNFKSSSEKDSTQKKHKKTGTHQNHKVRRRGEHHSLGGLELRVFRTLLHFISVRLFKSFDRFHARTLQRDRR